MYIRSKVSKGHTYYQIVDGVRVGAKVVQRVLIPLGTTSDPKAALKNMRQELVELRREYTHQVIRSDRRIENYHRRIRKLEVRIRDLSHIVKHKLLESAPRRCTVSVKRRAYHEAGHAVARFLAGLSIEHVTIDAGDTSSGHVAFRKPLKTGKERSRRAWPDFKKRFHQDLEFLCAGSAAERIACGDHQIVISGPGPASDWDKIKGLMAGLDLTEDEVWVHALERFHGITDSLGRPEVWAQVEALAKALMTERWIAGARAKAICKLAHQ
jgi:hypothetical protein